MYMCVAGEMYTTKKNLEGNLAELVLSFHLYMVPRDQAQVSRLVQMLLYPLNHLFSFSNPCFMVVESTLIILENQWNDLSDMCVLRHLPKLHM